MVYLRYSEFACEINRAQENSLFFPTNNQRVVGYSRDKAFPNPWNSKKNGCAGIFQMNFRKRQLVLV